MKIKELHLRNIASIEKADIDFSKDLADAVTGDPASVFLISGDTGAGKSVILDGISMALYKTTPRVEGVSNKKENSFTDAAGESIKVNSIEQYTRLGISEKDESYSELVFEGNDGLEYRAKLTLGMSLSNTDKTTGKRYLKHRKSDWKVKKGSADWTGDSVESTILNAVGLTFTQFGRMAMLAQGQFASFLTGGKAERESILEQLTNTEHFTKYGDAIKRLSDRYAEKRKLAEALYDAEDKRKLSEDEVRQFTEAVALSKDEKETLATKIQDIDSRITLVNAIGTARSAKAKAGDDVAALEKEKKGEEYIRAKALSDDWDATVEVRQRLSDRRAAAKGIRNAESEEERLRESFMRLSSDLEARRAASAAAEASLMEEKKWLDQKAVEADLYAKAGEISLKAENFNTVSVKLVEKTGELDTAMKATEGLKAAAADAEKEAVNAKKAVEAKQQEINSKTEERDLLNPSKVNDDLLAAGKKRAHLEGIRTESQALEAKRSEAANLDEEIRKDRGILAELKEMADRAQSEYETAKALDDNAAKSLAILGMSREEVLVNLRKEMEEQHAEVCPLCGQHVAEHHVEEYFSGIVSPFEKQKMETGKALSEADSARIAAKGEFDKFNATLEGKKNSRKKLDEVIVKAAAELAEKATREGLLAGEQLEPQLVNALSGLEMRERELTEAKKKAESLQASIDALLTEKQPLDVALRKAEENRINTANAVSENKTAKETLDKAVTALVAEKASLEGELSLSLGTFCPEWREDVDKACGELKAAAAEYNRRKESWTAGQQKHEKDVDAVGTLAGFRSSVVTLFHSWDVKAEPLSAGSRDINGEWTKLLADVQQCIAGKESFGKTVFACDEILTAYYAASGKDEAFLDAVSDGREGLETARALVTRVDGNLKSRSDAFKEYDKSISENMEKLGVAEEADIPSVESLDEVKAGLTEKKEAAVSNLTAMQQKLDDNDAVLANLASLGRDRDNARAVSAKWGRLNDLFGGTKFRTLVQTYILRPLLNNANIYLKEITERYVLTCSEENEQLSILVHDKYNKNQVRSVTVLSGGERFMISLALSLALSSLNRPDMNVNILFIDEGFGTLDEKSLDSVMQTLETLQEIAGQSGRRVGIISHREELDERIPVQIRVVKKGEGRSVVEIKN